MADSRKILIVGPSWVGDMVMAQSLFIALKQQTPDSIIDVLAPGWSLPVLERMPEIRKGIAMPVGHGKLELAMRYRLGKSLRSEGYDQAILLPNSLKSALVPLFAGIPRRTGWRGEMRYGLLNDLRVLDKEHYPLMVQRFVALAYPPGKKLGDHHQLPRPLLQIEASKLEPLLTRFGFAADMPFLALCPGAEFGPAKKWPESHYAEVAAAFLARGWQVALFGSANDREATENILQLLPESQRQNCINLAGETALAEAVDVMSAAGAVVSNDSGLMHMAAALGRPLIVVYGSTSPKFTPPLSDCVSVQQLVVECGPCFQRECPQGHLKCLNELSAEQVIKALDGLLTDSKIKVVR